MGNMASFIPLSLMKLKGGLEGGRGTITLNYLNTAETKGGSNLLCAESGDS